jgi:hypothetical protein
VTVDVGPLDRREVASALERGVAAAEPMASRGLIVAAFLSLRGAVRTAGQSGTAVLHSPPTEVRRRR